MMRPRSVLVQDNFFSKAPLLRKEFEERFENPRIAHQDRFCWDYWVVPEQYRLLRTPAPGFFNPKIYRTLHESLVLFGRRVLGCHDISPPWMSAYVDGHYQRLHGDLPHGPWAFVFSLTKPAALRRGGETVLLREPWLDFWRSHQNLPAGRGLESQELFEKIEPKFNRLVTFDPRIPHGVQEVRGVEELKDSRLVIHGWFVNPRPYIEGPLKEKALSLSIEKMLEALDHEMRTRRDVSPRGCLSFRFQVSSTGKVRNWKVLTHTVRDEQPTDWILKLIQKEMERAQWQPKPTGSSWVTLPIQFT